MTSNPRISVTHFVASQDRTFVNRRKGAAHPDKDQWWTHLFLAASSVSLHACFVSFVLRCLLLWHLFKCHRCRQRDPAACGWAEYNKNRPVLPAFVCRCQLTLAGLIARMHAADSATASSNWIPHKAYQIFRITHVPHLCITHLPHHKAHFGIHQLLASTYRDSMLQPLYLFLVPETQPEDRQCDPKWSASIEFFCHTKTSKWYLGKFVDNLLRECSPLCIQPQTWDAMS